LSDFCEFDVSFWKLCELRVLFASSRQGLQKFRISSVFGFPFQSANRIDESYYKGMRLRRDAAARASTGNSARGAQRKRGNKKGTTKRPSLGGCVPHAGREMRGSRLGYEVTSQTQAVQSTAVMSLVFRSSLPTEGDGVSPPRPPSVVVGGETRKERKGKLITRPPWCGVRGERRKLEPPVSQA